MNMKRIKLFIKWLRVKKGKEHITIEKGAGYYIPVGVLFYNPLGKIEEWKMHSGKTAIVKLLDFERYSDPDDMIKSSIWAFSGYKGETLVKDMGFKEFLKLTE